MMKTPDALVNGETTVEVIQSCMPNIKDAWKIPVIDLDVILIAGGSNHTLPVLAKTRDKSNTCCKILLPLGNQPMCLQMMRSLSN